MGGHCIGVDSRYLAFGAEQVGYHSDLIPTVRRINDRMGKFVAEKTVKALLEAGKELRGARVAILGFTFKENCPDIRNTKVSDVIRELREYQAEVFVTDPLADPEQVRGAYNEALCSLDELRDMDAVVLAVAHDAYRNLSFAEMDALYGAGGRVLLDIKGILNPSDFASAGYLYRRL